MHAWSGQRAWTVLDTDFHDGLRFLQTWLAWQQDLQRPALLHYVGIAPTACTLKPDSVAATPAPLAPLAQALQDACAGLTPGFHRILLDEGRVSLTLCLGTVHAALSAQAFQADAVFAAAPLDKWDVQLLARRSQRGTRLCVHAQHSGTPGEWPGAELPDLLRSAGFQLDAPVAGRLQHADPVTGRYDPPWDIPKSRTPAQHVMRNPARCAVIGAGLSGSSVAQALALRGWRVTVYDQDNMPASGASGLPAGLAVPHVSVDDSPRSRLSRTGTGLVMQHAQRLLQRGQDWEPSGVLEQRPGADPVWHPHAAWIKPATLVRAWLAQPGITFTGQAQVHQLHHADGLWQLLDQGGKELGRAELVVVANAGGCARLLQSADAQLLPHADLADKLAALQAIHGTLSCGTYAEAIPNLPSTPVNGNGCFIPHVPGPQGEQWFAGSSYELDALAAADGWAQHHANMARLAQLLPVVGPELADTLDRGPVSHWSATRCVTHDRLPLVGSVQTAAGPGLWLCVGMGSRGLSLAALCAQLLVARLGAEPLPVEVGLARSLDANRPRRKRASAALAALGT